MYCKADFLRTLTPAISGLWMPLSKIQKSILWIQNLSWFCFNIIKFMNTQTFMVGIYPELPWHSWNGPNFSCFFLGVGVSCNLWSTNLASWEASGSCQLDVHGKVGCRQRICLHEGFEGPKRTRKKWMIPLLVCQREPFMIMFVSLLRMYYLHVSIDLFIWHLFNYLSMFFIYVLFLFMHSFIRKYVNKPTSPCRVALHWRFLPKWEFKVGTSIDPWYIQDEGFPVPSPIDQNRHVVVMSFVGMLRNCVWVLQMCEHVLNHNTLQTTI